MKLRLRHKVIGLALGSALFPAVALSVYIAIQEPRSSRSIEDELGMIVSQNLRDTAEEIRGLCMTANELLQKHVDATLKVAEHVMDQEGKVTLAEETVDWLAINQFSLAEEPVILPKMEVGGVWLGQNYSDSVPTPVVDAVSQMVGGTATIFQRMNDSGDMLRVATNVINADGQRAIGTYIPAVNPDGSPNKVVQTVLRDAVYRGSAFVVNNWYVTAYKPIKDELGEVIGILYVGLKRDSVPSLQRALDRVEVGAHGYVWIMYGSGHRRAGEFVYTQERFPYQADVGVIKDVKGAPYLDHIREAALRLAPGEVGERKVTLPNPTDPDQKQQAEIHFTYFEDWDWVIGVTAFEADYSEPRRVIAAAFREIMIGTAIGSLLVVIGVGFLSTYLGGLIARPISFLTDVAGRVAKGDLGGALSMADHTVCHKKPARFELADAKDETGELYRAIMAMIENLKGLIGEVKQSSGNVLDSASEISGTARLQEGTVQDFGSSTNEIAAAVKEITTTAQELTGTMSNVSDNARKTGEAAGQSRGYLDKMQTGAEELSLATHSISDKLSVITERAANINNIVTTIAKVADQTNLLSLNAAIEAEKAGEFGLGFAVVAREIRRLADQTAVATLDIEQMVREMQSSVNAGVMEMDKFHQAVRGSVDDISRLGQSLENIITQVQGLAPRFNTVKEGMQAQATGASQIAEAVSQLNIAAQQTGASLQNFRSATQKLDKAVQDLRTGVSRFHTEAPEDDTVPKEGGTA